MSHGPVPFILQDGILALPGECFRRWPAARMGIGGEIAIGGAVVRDGLVAVEVPFDPLSRTEFTLADDAFECRRSECLLGFLDARGKREEGALVSCARDPILVWNSALSAGGKGEERSTVSCTCGWCHVE